MNVTFDKIYYYGNFRKVYKPKALHGTCMLISVTVMRRMWNRASCGSGPV